MRNGYDMQDAIEVTPADRRLFKMIITGMAGASRHPAIDSGGFDLDERMQEIARHRLAATPTVDATSPIEVQEIETVPMLHPFENGETDPFWRIEIDGFCADFETRPAAVNFAAAIDALVAARVAQALAGAPQSQSA